MKLHPELVLNTFLHNINVEIPCITTSVSYQTETVHLQLEEIRQDIQDANSDYLANIPTPDTNIMDAADETMN